MSLIVPDSTVNMYADVPISAGHQLVFSNRSAQNTYFLNKRLVTKAGCSYIRKTGRLRIEFNAARVQQCNYMSFTNTSFENVTFYAQILDYEYVNNETTDVLYAIDYWQTYMFDADYHACSILREHLTEVDYQKAVANPWRRDIPELLTDEGLPCGEELETIYENGTLTGIEYTGNRFKLPAASVPGISFDRTKYIVLSLSSFDIREWVGTTGDKIDASDVIEFINLFDYTSNNVQISSSSSLDEAVAAFNSMFVTLDAGIIDCEAEVGFELSNLSGLRKALDLLTANSCSGSITGMYVLEKWMMSGYFRGLQQTFSAIDCSFKVKKESGINPKLNTYPYRYVRVKTPQDTKEYRLDLFSSLQNGELVNFKFYVNMIGAPVLSLMPYNYKNDSDDVNFYERIDFANFPQLPYSIDGYLTYYANQCGINLMSNTVSGRSQLATAKDMAIAGEGAVVNNGIGALFGLIPSGVTGSIKTGGRAGYYANEIGGAAAAGISSASGMLNVVNDLHAQALSSVTNLDSVNQNIAAFNEAGSGSRLSGAATSVYAGQKRTFVNDNYVAGSSGGYLPYQVDAIDFIVEVVELEEDIKDKYSTYLDIYGYKSLRTGIPHICDYITDGSNTPHFTTFDDETFTYVQTENMHVSGVQATACAAIENLFNAGCRFLKGD